MPPRSSSRGSRKARRETEEAKSKGKASLIEVEGEVVDTLPNTMFRVRPIGPNGKPLQLVNGSDGENPEAILAHLSGRMRLRFIRVGVGDRVKLELSPYDLTRGRITWRLRNERMEQG